VTRSFRPRARLLVTIVCAMAAACRLQRPETAPFRAIEPQLVEPPPHVAGPGAIAIRLLETQAREHIGRKLLWRQTNGELAEDPIWHWSSSPDRYLDTALRLEVESSSSVRLVDASYAPILAATLLVWDLETSGSQLVGAVEFRFTAADRAVHTHMVRASEPISSGLPGNLAEAAGRLLQRLASDGLTRAIRAP